MSWISHRVVGARRSSGPRCCGDHPHTEDDLRYARRRYLTVEACREVARLIANATTWWPTPA